MMEIDAEIQSQCDDLEGNKRAGEKHRVVKWGKGLDKKTLYRRVVAVWA